VVDRLTSLGRRGRNRVRSDGMAAAARALMTKVRSRYGLRS
jgi:hypothetical protein